MQNTVKNNFYRLGIAAVVVAFSSVACNNSDYKTSDNSGAADSSVVANPAASSTPAGQPAAASGQPAAAASGQRAAADMDTINNMGQVETKTTAMEPTAANKNSASTKSSTAKSSAVTAPVAGVKGKKRASTSIVYTEKMAGATMPEFPGGQRALDNYVNDHINYPQDAVDNDVAGVVRVSFVVDEQGKISKAKLVSRQRIGNGLDEEALRVVNKMPEWKPATMHGKKIKTRLELPISFQVES
jgi:protein TonB